MGQSKQHASTVPLVLNPDTGSITPQFHVVFDDWFATVATNVDALPDFESDEWKRMFGDSIYQYYPFDDDDDLEGLPPPAKHKPLASALPPSVAPVQVSAPVSDSTVALTLVPPAPVAPPVAAASLPESVQQREPPTPASPSLVPSTVPLPVALSAPPSLPLSPSEEPIVQEPLQQREKKMQQKQKQQHTTLTQPAIPSSYHWKYDRQRPSSYSKYDSNLNTSTPTLPA